MMVLSRPMRTAYAAVVQFVAIFWWPAWSRTARRAIRALCPPLPAAPHATRQLLVDVSIIASHDAGTGIQRVVRSLLARLLAAPPAGFVVRPVQATRWQPYRYANAYAASLGARVDATSDTPVEVAPGDIFLGLDLCSRIAPCRQRDLLAWRAQGVQCVFVVYDLLPLSHPHWFTPRAQRSFRHWMSTLAVHADALFCISEAVAADASAAMRQRFGLAHDEPETDWFHLGADLPPRADERDIAHPAGVPAGLRSGHAPAVLMVGTVEPRKGHAQVLDAFEQLWRDGSEVTLVVAGRPGWHVEPLVKRLLAHTEAGKRLVWLSDLDDAQLSRLYASLDGLVMASEAEGFGLPLIEAAHHGMPIFARELPVFREVAGDHATWFDAADGATLAAPLRAWLALLTVGGAPASAGLNVLTWSGSAAQLKTLIAKLAR